MIDITNLTSLITAFRYETEQGSISPETLGALLQAIAEEIQNAASEQDQVKLSALYDNVKTMGTCLQSITQGDADRNNILANIVQFNPILGAATISSGGVFIKQATTERAGAMRAQHVDDLYTAKKNISALQTTVNGLVSDCIAEESKTFAYADDYGSSISGTCIRHGSLCTVLGNAYLELEQTAISTILPYKASDDFRPTLNIYYEDTMQWVRVDIYNDLNGTHINAQIPEDFMNGGEVFVKFSLSYIIQS